MLVLFAATIVGRAAQLQLLDHAYWSDTAERQHVRDLEVTPPRGAILDATGNVFVETREQMQLEIASHELKPVKLKGADGTRRLVDSRAVVRQTLRDLRVPDSSIRKVLRQRRQYVTLPKLFLPADVQRLAGLPGVSRKRVLTRAVSTPPSLRMLVGSLTADGKPNSGLELELDAVLRGEEGHDPVVLDGRGGRIGSPMLTPVAARPGHSVTLTINQSLQEIAEAQLRSALEKTGASGGDVVMLDPRDGAILAMAGMRDRKPALSMTALTEPYEPGSVMKPFVISRLLETHLARPEEMINTENGTAKIAGRVLTDEHKAPMMSVRDVVRQSSNIGTAKLAQRFSYAQQYQVLRDFGFGTPTGLPYPAEARGSLKLPGRWLPMTQASTSIGYEVTATPVQLAAAYAAFASNGELLQPALVREIRDANDQLLFQHQRRVIRRVVSEEGAALMRTMLESVVDSGTARGAEMVTFDVAGKSGTAKRLENGRYGAGLYNSTFAGMFPAQRPQYVVIARLIDSKNGYFGGTVAGGLVKGILQSALATRDASLDRQALASVAKAMPTPPPKPVSPAQRLAMAKDSARRDSLKAPPPPRAEPVPAAGRVVFDLPAAPAPKAAAEPTDLRTVPSVFGLDPRQAARTLYAAGFRVSLAAGKAAGRDVRTRPAAGVLVRAGSTVQLETPK
jgi:cell division protein FtsI (penicillin-binding protein 3)